MERVNVVENPRSVLFSITVTCRDKTTLDAAGLTFYNGFMDSGFLVTRGREWIGINAHEARVDIEVLNDFLQAWQAQVPKNIWMWNRFSYAFFGPDQADVIAYRVITNRFEFLNHGDHLVDKNQQAIKKILNCQDLGPPYGGWNLKALAQVYQDVFLDLSSVLFPQEMTTEVYILHHFLIARSPNRWNITELNEATREALAYLGLPLPKELKPFSETTQQRFHSLISKFRNT